MQLSNEKSVMIVGIGHAHPPHRIENTFFESLAIDSDAQWVSDRTGIEARHSVLCEDRLREFRLGQKTYQDLFDEGEIPLISKLAKDPWAMAQRRFAEKNSGFTFDCDLLISGCSVPDFDIPANASAIAKELAIGAVCLDVNSACSSFCSDLMVAYAQIKSELSKQVAIFNVERYSIRLDYKDKRSCVLFGDGSSCALVANGEKGLQGFRIIDVVMHSDASSFDAVIIPESGYFNQNGAKVQKFAISKTVEVSQEILKKNGLTANDLSYFIGHQANLRMLQSAATKLELNPQKHLYNVDQFGNQGAAGAPIVLSQNWHRYKDGDLVLVSVVGAGLTWGSVLMQWQG